jgi:predicted amidophosphoribosyltransferase
MYIMLTGSYTQSIGGFMPFCPKCGTEISEDVKFCQKCATNPQSNPSNIENLSLWEYHLKCIKNYVNFKGRARRRDFIWVRNTNWYMGRAWCITQ